MILVVCAPSGTGKTTLVNRLLKENDSFQLSVSTTTRHKRPGETHGVDYYYVDRETFRGMADRGEFLEWAEVHGNYYGSTQKEVDRIMANGKIPVFDIDIQGSRILRTKTSAAVYIFLSPPSFGVLKERLTGRRSESEEQISLRLKNAKREMQEFKDFDYIIINDDFERAYGDFLSIVNAESCRTGRAGLKIEKILEDFDDNTTR